MLDPPIEPGDLLEDKYVVEEEIGRGGMGVVVRARHVQLDQPVAIKILREGFLAGDEAQARFLREARALARFQNENVVRVMDLGRLPSGTPYMVMEYLAGSDLSALLRERGPLPVEEAADYVMQAAAGLSEAHAEGIVHRDLKPGNLFLAKRPDGTQIVKVIDFGVAKSVAGGTALTQGHVVLGSPRYMAPEQLKSSRHVDTRADVWALGAILYRLLTDRTPFEHKGMQELLKAITTERPKRVRHWRPELPEELDDAIDRCLQLDPNDRTPSVAALARELAPFAPSRAQAILPRIAHLSSHPPPPAPATDTGAPMEALAPTDADRDAETRAEKQSDAPNEGNDARDADREAETRVERPEAASVSPEAREAPPPSAARPAPTVSMTVPMLDAPASALVQRAPPAKSRVWLWFTLAILVVGLVALAVAMTVTGGVASFAFMAANTEIGNAPLPSIDASRADAVQLYPEAKALAKQMAPNARLVGIDLESHVSRGLVDLNAGGSIVYTFEFDAGAGSTQGNIVVEGLATGFEASRMPFVTTGDTLPDPVCTAVDVWNAIEASGVPTNASAVLRYGDHPGAATWVVTFPNDDQGDREVDATTCRLVTR